MMIDQNMIARLQRDIRGRVEAMQAELATKRVEGKAGGGAVVVIANGNREVLEVRINKDVVDPDDVEMLQDLVVAATNAAMANATKMYEEGMSGITGGLHFPGLF